MTNLTQAQTAIAANKNQIFDGLVVIRGAGDIATGIAVRLYHCGFRIVMTETTCPTMIRCSVSFAQSIYQQDHTVEGVKAQKANNLDEVSTILEKGAIPVIIDENLSLVETLNPTYLIDAILAKRNLNFNRSIAPITIALGPGFDAGKDCDAVIETNRGHHLGRVIYQGHTADNTGVPGNIAGFTHQRVVRAPCAGTMRGQVLLGDIVQQGQLIAMVDKSPVCAPLAGMVRGLLNNDIAVPEGFKIADIDPRGTDADFTTVSDKARAIGGSVLEAMLHLAHKRSHAGK